MKKLSTFFCFFLLFLAAGYWPTAQASTGNGAGVLAKVNNNSFDLIFKRIGFISTFGNPRLGETVRNVKGRGFLQENDVCLLDGILSNFATVKPAMKAGKRFYMHNNRSSLQIFELSNAPEFLNGIIDEVNTAEQYVVFKHTLKNPLRGRNHNQDEPLDTLVRIDYDPSMVFKFEGQTMSAEQALKVGRHLRVYDQRKQTIQSFSPSARQFDQTSTKSYVQKGFFRGWRNGNAYFAEHRNGQWHESWKEDGANANYHIMHGTFLNKRSISGRPGDRVVYVPYSNHNSDRDTWQTKNTFFRANDEETIEGTLMEVDGNTITLQVVSCPTGLAKDVDTSLVDITLKDDAKYQVDGLVGKSRSEALQVGNYLVVKKEWAGALLTRETNMDRVTVDQPNVKPYFLGTDAPDVRFGPDMWQQPTSIDVLENEKATFKALARGPENTTQLQWLKDGEPVSTGEGANTKEYSRIAEVVDDGSVFRLRATNSAGTTVSLPIKLNVIPDDTPLEATGQIMDEHTIELVFNQKVPDDDGTHGAENLGNYSIDGGMSIDTAVLLYPEHTKVVLRTETAMTVGNSYNVTIEDIQSFVTASPNTIPNGSQTLNLTLSSDAPGAKQFQAIRFNSSLDTNLQGEPLRVSFPEMEVSSGLPAQISIVSGPAEKGIQILLEDTGQVVIKATQSGNDEYYPASPVFDTAHISGLITALERPKAPSSLRFYPNPSQGRLVLESQAAGSLQVIDMTGRIRAQSPIRKGQQQLNFDLASGLYILRFQGRGGQVATEKWRVD